jgi:iron complex outermembrane receptor protein
MSARGRWPGALSVIIGIPWALEQPTVERASMSSDPRTSVPEHGIGRLSSVVYGWHNRRMFFNMPPVSRAPRRLSSVVSVVIIGFWMSSFDSSILQAQGPSSQTQSDGGSIRFRLPTVTVTAQKEPEDIQETPVSVTAVTSNTLDEAGVQSVSQAGQFVPNTFFNEFTARKLSNARFRGVGSSPSNPGITTYFDGVPQLNANSSSIELVDVNQIEFIRGPQGALFGRNTLGGLINITSTRPSFKGWSGSVTAPFGNFGEAGFQGTASGPVIADRLALGFGVG